MWRWRFGEGYVVYGTSASPSSTFGWINARSTPTVSNPKVSSQSGNFKHGPISNLHHRDATVPGLYPALYSTKNSTTSYRRQFDHQLLSTGTYLILQIAAAEFLSDFIIHAACVVRLHPDEKIYSPPAVYSILRRLAVSAKLDRVAS